VKVVLRVLDDAGALLGWTAIEARARGDGCLWSPGPVALLVDAPGAPALVSLHWCDLNVEVRVPLPAQSPVEAGQALTVYREATPLIVCGQPPASLAPVTVRAAAAITVPVRELHMEARR
jgi:hypothetical protein